MRRAEERRRGRRAILACSTERATEPFTPKMMSPARSPASSLALPTSTSAMVSCPSCETMESPSLPPPPPPSPSPSPSRASPPPPSPLLPSPLPSSLNRVSDSAKMELSSSCTFGSPGWALHRLASCRQRRQSSSSREERKSTSNASDSSRYALEVRRRQ